MLLEARFDACCYRDALFSTLQIPFPAHLAKSVSKRRAEYLASRYCLQQALSHFGVAGFVLENDVHRAPVWPAGMRGSLSHSHQCLCALLTRRADVLTGIDCEQFMLPQVALETADMVISDRERACLAATGVPFARALTAVFSLKESLFKAVWPRLGQFMDFSGAEVFACSDDMRRVSVRLTLDYSAEFYRGREFSAEVEWQPDSVMTWVIGPQ